MGARPGAFPRSLDTAAVDPDAELRAGLTGSTSHVVLGRPSQTDRGLHPCWFSLLGWGGAFLHPRWPRRCFRTADSLLHICITSVRFANCLAGMSGTDLLKTHLPAGTCWPMPSLRSTNCRISIWTILTNGFRYYILGKPRQIARLFSIFCVIKSVAIP